jgi:hypothetical protein
MNFPDVETMLVREGVDLRNIPGVGTVRGREFRAVQVTSLVRLDGAGSLERWQRRGGAGF